MKAYLRHLSVTSDHAVNGAVHFEQQCRMSLIYDADDVPLDVDAEQAAFRDRLQAVFREWCRERQCPVLESRVDTTVIQSVGFSDSPEGNAV